jgi:hypothetical protein
MRNYAICLFLLHAITAAWAQNSPAPSGPQVLVLNGLQSNTSETGGFIYHEVMRGGEFVKGAPYTATAVTETTQVLGDGNRIVNKSVALLARDSEGRTRREETVSNLGPLHTSASRLAFITDPVAKTEYVLDLDNHTARVHQLSAVKVLTSEQKEALFQRAPGQPLRSTSVAEVKQQALPDERIDGITCERILQTETIPAGSIGNERTIVVTSQTCASPELHLLLMRKRNDPRYGTTDYQLTGIQKSEPDASLFKVPSDFKAINKGSSSSH